MALGYPGYPGLRKAIRGLGEPDPAHPVDNELQDAVRGEVATLARLADRLADGTGERSAVADAAKLLSGSRPLPVLGLRAAAPVAGDIGRRTAQRAQREQHSAAYSEAEHAVAEAEAEAAAAERAAQRYATFRPGARN